MPFAWGSELPRNCYPLRTALTHNVHEQAFVPVFSPWAPFLGHNYRNRGDDQIQSAPQILSHRNFNWRPRDTRYTEMVFLVGSRKIRWGGGPSGPPAPHASTSFLTLHTLKGQKRGVCVCACVIFYHLPFRLGLSLGSMFATLTSFPWMKSYGKRLQP